MKKKCKNLSEETKELEALKHFLSEQNVDEISAVVDYRTIADALQDMIPGFYGYYFLEPFYPLSPDCNYTTEQQQAYEQILSFLDNTKIRIPSLSAIFRICNAAYFAETILAKTAGND